MDLKPKECESVFKTISQNTPCLIVCVAKIAGGKSSLIGALYKYLKQHNTFDNEIIVSPTIHTDFWTKLGVKQQAQFHDMKFEQLRALFGYQKQFKKNRVLLIFDDILGSNIDTRNREFLKLTTTLRHLNTTVIVIAQAIRKIDVALRVNCDFLLIGKMNGMSNINIVYDELFNGQVSKKDFGGHFDKWTDDYTFVFMNNRTMKSNDKLHLVYCDLSKWKVPKVKN